MELWIRSQDKEKLLKISGIQYQNCKLVENETVEANILIGFYSSYENEILGEYNTKERALEVLDEIQNILKPTIITTGYECELKENIKDKTSFNLDMIPTKTEIQELSTVVYQMPED